MVSCFSTVFKTSQELQMLSNVTLNCQVAKIVMNSGSLGYSANHFLLSWILYPRYVMRVGIGIDTVLSIFVFGSIIMGKEPLAELNL